MLLPCEGKDDYIIYKIVNIWQVLKQFSHKATATSLSSYQSEWKDGKLEQT